MNLREDFKALCEEGEPLLILDENDFVQLIEKYMEMAVPKPNIQYIGSKKED